MLNIYTIFIYHYESADSTIVGNIMVLYIVVEGKKAVLNREKIENRIILFNIYRMHCTKHS